MKEKATQCLLNLFAMSALVLICASGQRVAAQEGSKDIGVVVPSEEVVERTGKPSNTRSRTRPTNRTGRPSQSYRSLKPLTRHAAAPNTEYAAVGVTIRRLQVKEGAKELDQEGEEAQLEQVAKDAPLTIDSRVRIYLEPLERAGFLYVIDREQFADGGYGVPLLIFPTLRTNQGKNRVDANELIQIPRPPSYFRINPSSTGKTQVAEVLTVIISPTPLELPGALSGRAMTLSVEQFKEWERKWSVPLNEFEIVGGAGQTERAKDLDQVGEEAQLTDEDPLPETVYRATLKKGNPLLVTVPLRFKAQ